MTGMDRWLRSRFALIFAWSVVGAIVLGAAVFGLFLLSDAVDGDGNQAATATPVLVLTGTTTPKRGLFGGVVDRNEGQVVSIRIPGGELVRAVIRRGTPVGRTADSTVRDLKASDPVIITTTSEGGRQTAFRIRVQPATIPVAFMSAEGRLSTPVSSSSGTITGQITGIDGNFLRVKTDSGEIGLPIAGNVRVSRFTPVQPEEIRKDQRIVIDGETLVDGTLSARSVQVFD